MTLNPKEASTLRHQILRDLQVDRAVTLDSRFINPIFGSELELSKWLKSWRLKAEQYFTPSERRVDGTPIMWLEISYETTNTFLIISP